MKVIVSPGRSQRTQRFINGSSSRVKSNQIPKLRFFYFSLESGANYPTAGLCWRSYISSDFEGRNNNREFEHNRMCHSGGSGS